MIKFKSVKNLYKLLTVRGLLSIYCLRMSNIGCLLRSAAGASNIEKVRFTPTDMQCRNA